MARTKKTNIDVEVKTEVKDPIVEKTQKVIERIVIPGTNITDSMLNDYRTKYKKLYRSDYIDDVYIWHRLNRHDFTKICGETESIKDEEELITEREKRFCYASVLFPQKERLEELFEDSEISSKIAEEILYKSGFFRPQTREI